MYKHFLSGVLGRRYSYYEYMLR